ncbi:MAG: hypothetical protein IJX86_04815 [Lachnospiraceae bacterium]|nr:hypothetical protein [Lachnospiraceae bacterium]
MENGMMSAEKNLVHSCLYGNMTCIITTIITNIFYWIVLFLAWYIPVAGLVGLSIAAGLLIMGTVMIKACVVARDEEGSFIPQLLVYFPVNKKRYKKELYCQMFKYIGIEAIVACIPMLIMFMDFNLERFLITLASVLGTMFILGLMMIEGSMEWGKAQ